MSSGNPPYYNEPQVPNSHQLDGGAHPAGPQQQGTHPLSNYQFSREELLVLKQCNTESFFQRSLPLGTSFGLLAYFGVKNGTLRSNSRFGAVPKVVVSCIIGYFLGKVSYQRKCSEKLMQLPNSRLAEMLRQRKAGCASTGGFVDPALTPNFGLPFTTPKEDVYDDFPLRSQKSDSLDLDFGSSRPSGLELGDSQPSSTDNMQDLLPLEPSKKAVTYEELRKTNREQYQKSNENVYNKPLQIEMPLVVRTNEKKSFQEPPETVTPKNKYGDSWS